MLSSGPARAARAGVYRGSRPALQGVRCCCVWLFLALQCCPPALVLAVRPEACCHLRLRLGSDLKFKLPELALN